MTARTYIGAISHRVAVTCLLASLLGAGIGEAYAADKAGTPQVLFKVATIAPDGSTWMKLMHEMDKRVR
jgi:hypothetical protein